MARERGMNIGQQVGGLLDGTNKRYGKDVDHEHPNAAYLRNSGPQARTAALKTIRAVRQAELDKAQEKRIA